MKRKVEPKVTGTDVAQIEEWGEKENRTSNPRRQSSTTRVWTFECLPFRNRRPSGSGHGGTWKREQERVRVQGRTLGAKGGTGTLGTVHLASVSREPHHPHPPHSIESTELLGSKRDPNPKK